MEILGVKLSSNGYFINLDSSTDRLENVNNQIKTFNIKNLNRVSAITDPWIQSSCTKSHRKVFEIAKTNNEEVISVFEDDFQFNNDIRYFNEKVDLSETLLQIVKDMDSVDWDVILLGCNPKSDIIPITNNLGVIHKCTGGWAYIIKKRAYEYILENFNYSSDRLAIDDILPLLNYRGFKTLTTIPMITHHAIGFVSTLQPNGPVNYTIWIEGSWDKHYYHINKKI
jgi:GR25 family glycosyltransferase involved in LPS biosynthesis